MLGQRGWHSGSGHVTFNSPSLVRFLRQQGLYIALSAVVGAIFWAIGQQINPVTVLLYSLLIGNLITPALERLRFGLRLTAIPLQLVELPCGPSRPGASRLLDIQRDCLVDRSTHSAIAVALDYEGLETSNSHHPRFRRHYFSVRLNQRAARAA